MPRHELEVIKLLATEPIKTVIQNVLEPFTNFSRKDLKSKISGILGSFIFGPSSVKMP